MVTFQLHRIGVILVVVFSLILGVLIFATGYILGTRRAPKIAPLTAPAPTAPAPATATTPPPPSPSPSPARLTIRLGAFATEEEAHAALQSLTKRGITPELVPLTAGESTLYTLTSGRYATHAEATKAANALAKKGVVAPTVVPLPEE